jgi:CDP-diacylglycerol--serine O-phosphatidyltransferase
MPSDAEPARRRWHGGTGFASGRTRLRELHINRMIPNILTLLALASGLSALRFTLQERWEHAVLAVLVAAILDGLDGRIARILKGTSRFGAELDSLSDFLCFGVAPAFILYRWSLEDAGRFGWALVLVWCIAAALRLARFNTDLDDSAAPSWTRNFFTGMPSPAGAGMALLPLVLWLRVEIDLFRSPAFVAVVIVAGAMLLVSRVRTFAFKRIKLAQRWVLPAMIVVGLYVAALVSDPWLTLILTQIAYLASIPLSDRRFRHLQRVMTQPPATGSAA